VQLSTAGGRIIISSDGVWDALTAELALDCCRGMSAEAAAPHIVKVCTSFTEEIKKCLIKLISNFY